MDTDMDTKQMDKTKLFGYGAAIWAVVYFTAMLFVASGTNDGMAAKVVVPAARALAAFVAGMKLGIRKTTLVLRYTVAWIMIGLALDLALTIPFTGTALWHRWDVWMGYVLMLVAPLAGAKAAQYRK